MTANLATEKTTHRRRIWKRIIGIPLAVALVGLLVYLFVQWRDATMHGGQKYAEPFRIAGNLYYVGANDVTSFLITGPNGHILLDGGYPGTPPLILASISKLGFNIRDVKIIINSEPHIDHAGGLEELKEALGAELYASSDNADAIEAGGDPGARNSTFLPMRILVWLRIANYPSAHVDHRIKDGDTVRLGPLAVAAHITGGHTRGCTTWTFQVHESGRDLNVVSACSLDLLPGMRFVPPERYPGIREDFERTFTVLRSLPEDIWVTTHAREFGRYRKFVALQAAKDSANPFIDRVGYLAYIADAEARFRQRLAEQQRGD